MNGLLTIFNYLANNTHPEYNTIVQTQGFWSGYIKETKTPYQIYNILGNDVYIEGCIYNLSENSIKFFLKKVLNEKNDGG